MNRRKAIFRISLGAAGLATAFSGYQWYDITKAPDIPYLRSQKALLSALAETIIPATDSPGAKEAGVGDFISLMVEECTELKAQNKFINGLKELQRYSKEHFGSTFEQCRPAEQASMLQYFEKTGKTWSGVFGKIQNRFLGRSFFATLKTYTVEGYCTSEQGATQGLAYVYVPGSFQGCIPLQPGQKAWATN
jgi:hypothetical protein